MFCFLVCLFAVVFVCFFFFFFFQFYSRSGKLFLTPFYLLLFLFPCFFLFVAGKANCFRFYRRMAKIVVSMLRTLEGVVCNEINGSLYAFPSIKLPRKAVEAAKVRRFESSALHIDQIFSTFCVKEVLVHNLFK